MPLGKLPELLRDKTTVTLRVRSLTSHRLPRLLRQVSSLVSPRPRERKPKASQLGTHPQLERTKRLQRIGWPPRLLRKS